jgi:26S proteasome regulatory subunit N1
LGLCAAGTNNSRVANTLRQLADFYAKQADQLFCVRIAQGLIALGKGLLTLSPYHSDRMLLSPAALAGLLTVLHACLDLQATLLDKYHFLLFLLAPAMNTRYLLTVDDQLQVVSATARVGLAVETVGQAGRPKTITGFQV